MGQQPQLKPFHAKPEPAGDTTGLAAGLVKVEPRDWNQEEEAVAGNYQHFMSAMLDKMDGEERSEEKRRRKRTRDRYEKEVSEDDEDWSEEDKDWDWREEILNNLYDDDEKKPKKIKIKSEPGGVFECSQCDKTFNRQGRLDAHMYKKHMTSKASLKCEHCPKTFSRPGEKRVHEELHTKPYKCTECPAAFGRKSNLTGHLR